MIRVGEKVWSGGGLPPFAVGSLEAGTDKGETWLPPGGLVEHPGIQNNLYKRKGELIHHFKEFKKSSKICHFFTFEAT